jgi:hypothetical protein
MSIQAITTPPVALPPLPPLANEDPAPTSDADAGDASRPGSSSGITITRVDKQDYPDGYVVTTTHYANNGQATKTAPKAAPPPLVRSAFDPANGGQLSALLSAQEQTASQGPVVGINPYAR